MLNYILLKGNKSYRNATFDYFLKVKYKFNIYISVFFFSGLPDNKLGGAAPEPKPDEMETVLVASIWREGFNVLLIEVMPPEIFSLLKG